MPGIDPAATGSLIKVGPAAAFPLRVTETESAWAGRRAAALPIAARPGPVIPRLGRLAGAVRAGVTGPWSIKLRPETRRASATGGGHVSRRASLTRSAQPDSPAVHAARSRGSAVTRPVTKARSAAPPRRNR